MTETDVIAPVVKTVTVDCSVDDAFRVFTQDLLSWWPIDSHSIFTDDLAEVVFEERTGGSVYEVSRSGDRGHWATVLAWEPPRRLVLAWNVRGIEPRPTEVEVRFSAADGGTRVDLEHRGWGEVVTDGARKRASYDSGWDLVLGEYVSRLASTR
jgi:uncharacterized protein YndB with AHSA1/START domain